MSNLLYILTNCNRFMSLKNGNNYEFILQMTKYDII